MTSSGTETPPMTGPVSLYAEIQIVCWDSDRGAG